MDDVIIVSGHNIGTAEVESALVEWPSVAEAAVVGIPDGASRCRVSRRRVASRRVASCALLRPTHAPPPAP